MGPLPRTEAASSWIVMVPNSMAFFAEKPCGFRTFKPETMASPLAMEILTLSTVTAVWVASDPYFSMAALTYESRLENKYHAAPAAISTTAPTPIAIFLNTWRLLHVGPRSCAQMLILCFWNACDH